ncbi:MAG TPA: hypothetical protein DCG53_12615 [Syntrophus sp. (in: bacteria)]|nr:hypothetical protein [Syntrophus sp. (in: bacteria)]
MSMNPGQAIKSKEEDRFERFSFAEHLGNFLCLEQGDPSVVIGLEGKWGDGKTSCINLVKEVLNKKKPKPIIVDFNPWLISTLDSVIEGFIVELASAIGMQSSSDKGKHAAQVVLQFGRILSPIKLIPGAEPWGSMVESVLNAVGKSAKAASELANLSIQARKKDLQEHLNKINRPIVVIIDDVDRLPPDHVRIVFQMLKAICDFDRVSYLIAYAPEPVADALSYNGVYDGKKYLEKIVQTSYPLPRLPYIHMKDYAEKHLRALAEKYELNIMGEEEGRFQLLFHKTDFVRMLDTPRDVIRLCNRLHISVPKTRNEVAFADVIAFEMLALKFPEIFNVIRSKPDVFAGFVRADDPELASEAEYFANRFDFTEAPGRPKKIEILDDVLKKAGDDERKRRFVKAILIFMFPKFGGNKYHLESLLERGINRIHKRDALLQLLHCGSVSFAYSAEEARRFCQTPEERSQILADHQDDLGNWLDYLEKTVIESVIQNPVGLSDDLIEEVKGPEDQRSAISLPRRIGDLFYEIIKRQPDNDTRREILEHLAKNTQSLSISATPLRRFLAEMGIWKERKYFHDEETARSHRYSHVSDAFSYGDLYSLKDIWLQSVCKLAKEDSILETQKDVLSIFHLWGQLSNNDFSEVNKYIMDHADDGDWLIKFMRLFDVRGDIQDFIILVHRDNLPLFIEKVSIVADDDGQIKGILASLQSFLDENSKDNISENHDG